MKNLFIALLILISFLAIKANSSETNKDLDKPINVFNTTEYKKAMETRVRYIQFFHQMEGYTGLEIISCEEATDGYCFTLIMDKVEELDVVNELFPKGLILDEIPVKFIYRYAH